MLKHIIEHQYGQTIAKNKRSDSVMHILFYIAGAAVGYLVSYLQY